MISLDHNRPNFCRMEPLHRLNPGVFFIDDFVICPAVFHLKTTCFPSYVSFLFIWYLVAFQHLVSAVGWRHSLSLMQQGSSHALCIMVVSILLLHIAIIAIPTSVTKYHYSYCKVQNGFLFLACSRDNIKDTVHSGGVSRNYQICLH